MSRSQRNNRRLNSKKGYDVKSTDNRNKWDYIKLKKSAQQEKQSTVKRHPMEWEKIFATMYLLNSKICKELLQL